MKEIDNEIEKVEELLKEFPRQSVTDIWFDERYKALENYRKLLGKYKKLKIKYSNVEHELKARTKRYFNKED